VGRSRTRGPGRGGAGGKAESADDDRRPSWGEEGLPVRVNSSGTINKLDGSDQRDVRKIM